MINLNDVKKNFNINDPDDIISLGQIYAECWAVEWGYLDVEIERRAAIMDYIEDNMRNYSLSSFINIWCEENLK